MKVAWFAEFSAAQLFGFNHYVHTLEQSRLLYRSLLFVFDDVNRGLLGRCCASADPDVLSDQLCLSVFAKSQVRRDKSTCSRAANLTSLRKFGFVLGFVGALPLSFIEQDVDSRRRIWLFLRKHLVHGFRRTIRATSIRSLGRRISLVEHVVDTAVDKSVLWLKLIVVLAAVFACRRTSATVGGTHDLLAKVSMLRAVVIVGS